MASDQGTDSDEARISKEWKKSAIVFRNFSVPAPSDLFWAIKLTWMGSALLYGTIDSKYLNLPFFVLNSLET